MTNKIESSQKTVSIVIPTFNRCEFLRTSIKSSLNQTYPCSVVVCDHGSTDDTPNIMTEFLDSVTYIRREKDFGPHFCWLEGILNADSEFVHLQFDDDWIDETYIERCLEWMDDDVGLVIAEASNGFNFKKHFMKSGIFPMKKLEKLLLKGEMYSPGASLFRKKDLVDALYQGKLPFSKYEPYHGVGPDAFFTLLAALRYKNVGIITDELVFFREHENSITCDAHKTPDNYIKIKDAYKDIIFYYLFLKYYWVFDKFKYFNFRHMNNMMIFLLVKVLKKTGLYDAVRKIVKRLRGRS